MWTRNIAVIAIRCLAILSLLLSATPAMSEPPTYSLTRITSGFAARGAGINNTGDIVGTVNLDASTKPKHHAFIWYYKTHALHDVGTLGGSNSEGVGINDCQEVVGTSDLKGDKVRHAYVYYQGYRADLDKRGAGSSAASINNAGTVVGAATFNNELRPALFVVKTGAIHDLIGKAGTASGISLTGEIVGTQQPADYSSDPHTFIFADGTTTYLAPDTPHGDAGYAINDHLDVVGLIYGLKGAGPYIYVDGAPYGPGYIDVGSVDSEDVIRPTGINNGGEVVGTFTLNHPDQAGGFLFRSGATYRLNDLIDKQDPLAPFVFITGADGINDSDWIVANGVDSRSGLAGVYLMTAKDPAIQLQRITGGCSHH